MSNMAKINIMALRQGAEPAGRRRPRRKTRGVRKPTDAWELRRTLYEILIGWSEIRDVPRSEIRQCLSRMISLCTETGKDEVVIENIVPSFKVGRDDPGQILSVQDEIVALFSEAMMGADGELPEFRLGLRRGEFEVRFYMGRTRPTDFDFIEAEH